jgi:putative membrane protein
MLTVVRSRAVRVASNPATVIVLSAGGWYVLYLTPLYATAEDRPLLHAVVHLHMLVAGCLFAWCVVGVDPIPHRPSVQTRLLVLVAAAGAHDILAKIMYGYALPAGGGTPEQIRAGAQLMYYGGDAVEVLMALVLLSGWYARTGRALDHADRRADRGGVG